MSKTINILCATDDNYVPYCGIMLTSVFDNNKDSEIEVYILIDKPLSVRNCRRIERLSRHYHQKIHLVMVDNSFVAQFPTRGMSYWSVAMYYRLFAAELLPNSIDTILYLDCDIIVNSSIESLFEIDMEDVAIASVCDIYNFSTECSERLGYPPEGGYFNSGVLLMNMSYWREHRIGEECLDYLKNNYNCLLANDQDVLNAVLWNRKLELPLTYNYQLQFLSNYFFNLQFPSMKQNILDTYENPTIIHYAYSIKPWSVMYYRLPFSDVWEHYKRISQWSHTLPTLPRRKVVNNLIKRYIMWPMGLMKYNSGFVV
jgi:lipopolysaccharide biosynthesis glycosyltransferase